MPLWPCWLQGVAGEHLFRRAAARVRRRRQQNHHPRLLTRRIKPALVSNETTASLGLASFETKASVHNLRGTWALDFQDRCESVCFQMRRCHEKISNATTVPLPPPVWYMSTLIVSRSPLAIGFPIISPQLYHGHGRTRPSS